MIHMLDAAIDLCDVQIAAHHFDLKPPALTTAPVNRYRILAANMASAT